jgi:hypothetical protein
MSHRSVSGRPRAVQARMGSPAILRRQWVHRTSAAYVDDFGATVPPPAER